MLLFFVFTSIILAFVPSLQAAPALGIQERSERDDHGRGNDIAAAAAAGTVTVTALATTLPVSNTVTNVPTATATLSAANPTTTETILDLLVSFGLNETSSATELISALGSSNVNCNGTDIGGNAISGNAEDASGGDGGEANGGESGNGGEGSNGGVTDDRTIVNGNDFGSGDSFNGTTVDASNPRPRKARRVSPHVI